MFVKPKIPWWEAAWGGSLIGIVLFFYLRDGLRAPQPLGFAELMGALLYLTGSYVETASEYTRHLWTMNQHVALQYQSGKPFVVSCSSRRFIRTAQDFLELLAWGSEHETNLFMLEDFNFVSEFYDLKTGLAGEALQKLSNYSARLVIVGTFGMVAGDRFRELMAESNKGSQVHFARSRDEAISWLTK